MDYTWPRWKLSLNNSSQRHLNEPVHRHSGRVSIYLVAIVIGLSFTRIIVSIAWNSALETNKREFQLHAVALKESMLRNVNAAHYAINGIAAFLKANEALTPQQFEITAAEYLRLHPYIEGVMYARAAAGMNRPVFNVTYRLLRDPGQAMFSIGEDLHSDVAMRDGIQQAMETDAVVTTAVPSAPQVARNFWMIRSLVGRDRQVTGVLAMLVGTEQLLGNIPADTDLSITIFNDTASLTGRQLLYSKQSTIPDTGWNVEPMSDDSLMPFTNYSIKLSVSRDIHWQEVDKSGVFIALLIGLGGTLLLVALVRTKDQQTRQLQERNLIIERQVEEQTRELAETRDQALAASRTKSEFLASMSHEIRTPLNAIIGMSELLNETTLTDEQKKYIDVFRKAGDTLLALVNDILDLSKIEARQLVLEKIIFNLVEMVEEVVEIYAHKAAEKGIELLSEIDPGVNPARIGDPTRLRQIILNLISNSLKFTERGEIVVRVITDQGSGGEEKLHFSVRDTGIGIPRSKLEAIFESFTQVDSSTTRKYGGTGLGLTISRSLTNMMNGNIWVDSEEGKGSTFHFTVKLEVARKALPVTRLEAMAGKRILVVDDNATNRLIVNKHLTSQGAQIVEAEGADDALAKINTAAPAAYDMILVDCQMPGKDGFSLIEALKSGGQKVNTIMMLSSADLNENMSRAKALGLDKYLIKPVKQRELIQHVADALSSIETGKPVQVQAASVEMAVKPMNILLVDDNADNRLLIKAYVKKLPYTIIEAENGQEAVEKFQQADFDVVLMDVQMPIMDGHEATRTIREWEQANRKKRTMIISLTAHAIKEEIDKCLAAGCDSHLSKPIKKSTLLDTLESISH